MNFGSALRATVFFTASAAGCKRSGLAHGVRELADSDFMAPTPAQALSAHDSNGIADRLTVMNYTIDDERIAGPESVLTGAVEIRLTNRGHSLHELRVLRSHLSGCSTFAAA